MANRNIVKWHKLKIIKTNKTYWDWVDSQGEDAVGEGNQYIQETDRANPNKLQAPEQEEITIEQALMAKAISLLKGRQAEAYSLVMRQNKSIGEAGKILGLSKGTIQVYLNRAIVYITAYCRERIRN